MEITLLSHFRSPSYWFLLLLDIHVRTCLGQGRVLGMSLIRIALSSELLEEFEKGGPESLTRENVYEEVETVVASIQQLVDVVQKIIPTTNVHVRTCLEI